MKGIGQTMLILGILAIVLEFFGYVPKLLFWIYEWGEGVAWGIKIALIVLGGLIWLGANNMGAEGNEEQAS